jgi:transporter family protein
MSFFFYLVKQSIMPAEIVTMSLMVALLWGLAPVIHKYLLSSQVTAKTIMVVGGVAYFIVLLVYWLMYAQEVHSGIAKISWMDILLISIASVIMNFAAKLLYLYALKKQDSYIVSALVYSAPLFTLICAWLLLKERVTFWKMCGVMMIVGGIFLVSYH